MVTANFLLPLCVPVLLAASFVNGTPIVKDKTAPLHCNDPKIKYDQNCENDWTHNNTKFAVSNYRGADRGPEVDCVYPCKNIQDGVMTLYFCENVEEVKVCTQLDSEGKPVADETRTHYKKNAATGLYSGSWIKLLLLLLMCAFMVHQQNN